MPQGLRIRSRIDGILHEIPIPNKIRLLQDAVISRIKIMARMDIAEKRLPQDGRLTFDWEANPIDVRVTTIPSVSGESISLRLLGQERFDFDRLQLEPDVAQTFLKLLSLPNGSVFVTGPTGCGKSTTLYTFLSLLNQPVRRIVTVEDPVEYQLPGIVQIAVKPDIGLSFAAGLRSILRGDPNVIMVGEMRDYETAEIGIRAALTGHLVFSTLHTNDAIGAITRLLDMGVESFLIGSAVKALIAQRLVRTLCPHCKTAANHDIKDLKNIGFPVEQASRLYKPRGCPKCRNTGYEGRLALYEVCPMTPTLEDLIIQKKPATVLKTQAVKDGMISLREYGWRKAIQGKTSLEEVLRVTSMEEGTN
jgi:type II secretory ATPase GspE/PulE/Tfp pilus assembly ATPase PilB-like protein